MLNITKCLPKSIKFILESNGAKQHTYKNDNNWRSKFVITPHKLAKLGFCIVSTEKKNNKSHEKHITSKQMTMVVYYKNLTNKQTHFTC